MIVERLVNTDKLKREIAERLPITAVAERLCDVELVAAGHQMRGLCPIHGENTPSFHVNDGKQVFHCFGCKEGGDSIHLVQAVHHVGYRDALVMLAVEAGIDIQAYERPPTDDERAQDQLRAWCESWLASLQPHSSRVLPSRNALVPVLPRDAPDGFSEKGYLLTGEVLFPYRSISGRLVGWKVRHPEKRMFMTPNDFPLTEPVVWGLNEAREHIVDGKLIVVEGEFDRLALRDVGIENVGAIGGSKWTDEQMAIVEAAAIREVVFLLDGDEGGRSAGEGIAKRFWRHPKVRVRIALSWAGADPEDMLHAMGAAVVLDQVATARGALEWLLHQEWMRTPRETLSAKLDFVSWIQREYGDQLIGVQEALVLQEVARWMEVPEADVLDFVRANKTMLQVPDSEKVVLGRAMRDMQYYVAVRKRINRLDFYILQHQRVWETLEHMLADGLDFDLATIRRRAENQGVEGGLVDTLAQTGELNIGWHEEQIIDFSVRRSSRADADYFREVIADLNVPANQLIGALTHNVTSKALGRGSSALRAVSEQVDEAVERIHERMRSPNVVSGLDLGSQFPALSQNLDGFQRRRLVLVAATSGRGKSTISLQWMVGLAIQQAVPVDFISLEMDTDEILFKAASHMTGIDSQRISKGSLEKPELLKVEQAMMRIRKSPLRVYTPDGITPSEFLLYAREAVMERRTEVFVVDYAQMVGPDPDTQRLSRYEQLGQFAYLAKQKVCRGLDVCVVCCAQLKREAATKDEPTPEDIGDSYELVRASDVILIINENENQQHELWVGKNRQGPGQVLIPVVYDKPNQTFREASSSAKTPDYGII